MNFTVIFQVFKGCLLISALLSASFRLSVGHVVEFHGFSLYLYVDTAGDYILPFSFEVHFIAWMQSYKNCHIQTTISYKIAIWRLQKESRGALATAPRLILSDVCYLPYDDLLAADDVDAGQGH